MINSFNSLKTFLIADMHSLNIKGSLVKNYLTHHIWHFQIFLRVYEYVTNTKKNVFIRLLVKLIFDRKSRNLGFTIPINVFGEGLSIAHYGTIVVNNNSKIGKNCRIHVCVNIGSKPGSQAAPILGDNCYIGPGVKIYGGISLADGTIIGANSVVNKSVFEKDVTVVGIPAKKLEISDKR